MRTRVSMSLRWLHRVVAIMGISAIATPPLVRAASPTPETNVNVIFAEDWENGWGNWFASNGTWEIGQPTSGPNAAYHGSQCAATVLNGAYSCGANSRLISQSITLPSSPLGGKIYLSFWHWFSFHTSWGWDYGQVQVSTSGSSGPWTTLCNTFYNYGGGWTRYVADLTAYAGRTIRLGFLAVDVTDPYCYTSSGWYVDDILVFEGAYHWQGPETFERLPGLALTDGGWFADRGVWQIGHPTAGPPETLEEPFTMCAGTVLGGNYPGGADSRLISPPAILPNDPRDGKLWLSFWHWFNFHTSWGWDYGQVEVSTSGPCGPWNAVSPRFYAYCGDWSQYIADLSGYAGDTVYVAFHVVDVTDPYTYVSTGWYIDSPAIVEGRNIFNNGEGFETSGRDWFADRGVWEIGVPTAGPSSAHTGTRCAGTILDGAYPGLTDSRLISPPVQLPAVVPAEGLELRFWHWFAFHTSWGTDYGQIEVSTSGEKGPWTAISSRFTNSSSNAWTPYIIDLAAYAGQTVRIAFHMVDVTDPYTYTASGWYVDDIRFVGVPEGAPSSPHFDRIDVSAVDPPTLRWTNPAGAFDYICIYADRRHDFLPNLSNRIALVGGTSFTDAARVGPYFHYKISAVDAYGHESAVVDYPVSATDVPPTVGAGGLRLSCDPNPAVTSTAISFRLGTETDVRLEVFNVEGRRVRSMDAGRVAAGEHRLKLETRGLPPGIYLIRLQARDRVLTGKVAVVR